jgi:hypothetical protein
MVRIRRTRIRTKTLRIRNTACLIPYFHSLAETEEKGIINKGERIDCGGGGRYLEPHPSSHAVSDIGGMEDPPPSSYAAQHLLTPGYLKQNNSSN